MSQFSWFVSNYRLMNNRPKVFTRTWNSMNRFFRCLLFIDSHINDHFGINQNSVGWRSIFNVGKKFLSAKRSKVLTFESGFFWGEIWGEFSQRENYFLHDFLMTLIKWWCGQAWRRWHTLLLHIHYLASIYCCTYW